MNITAVIYCVQVRRTYNPSFAERIEGGYKATSSARLLSAMRRLFQYLYREKALREDDPTALLSSPKLSPQRWPKDLSEAQVDRLPNSPNVDIPLELRDKAMLEVLYATGLVSL